MKRLMGMVLSLAVLTLTGYAQEHEQDRLKHAGEVLQEILNIPDNIPKAVLDKSESVIVIPPVKKLAIGVGGDYGRGAMSARGGAHRTGSWSAPTAMTTERDHGG